MKIALLGYGKMGRAIESIAVERGHEIGVTIDNEQEWNDRLDALMDCNIAVDFSMPATVVSNIRKCFALNMPIVVGTTGWYDELPTLVKECEEQGQSLFVASNFSIGMNIMFALNKRLAELMNPYPEYFVSMAETHHVHKLDAPSGTAITLAQDAIQRLDRKNGWQKNGELWIGSDNKTDLERSEQPVSKNELAPDIIPVLSVRQGEEAGTHTVVYDSDIDTLFISHRAKSRKGLALGAVLAAEYLNGKKGYHTMEDMLR